MDERTKREILESYRREKERGVFFYPDLLAKDAVVALLLFLALVALAYFVGAPLEDRADPADTSYTPRPEWYFLFLFQLLKYFPGSLEVIGVFVLPTLAILLLVALPFLDRGPKRHFLSRPWISAAVGISVVGVLFLTVQAYLEAPPPAPAAAGDPTAALYAENCASCHGPSIDVSPGTNLHEIIAQGKHEEGMPAWSGDLSSDEIDALAGFILSPSGSRVFRQACGDCHEVSDLVADNARELQQAVRQGPAFEPHAGVDIPDWREALSGEEQTALLNFLAAPDGGRLFAINCSPCHGEAVPFSGSAAELRQIIQRGGLHLEMPPWRNRLSEAEIDLLAAYVVDPPGNPQGEAPFRQYCSECHGGRVPRSPSTEAAREVITSGGAHETMPVWGEVLTEAQLEALVAYAKSAAEGTTTAAGRELFSQYCAACHGEFGEGGPNPSLPGDVIAPISTAEYLRTRDDLTLRAVIAEGQPSFGMSPFSTAAGGPLDDDQIEAIVRYMRSWEANPPVELRPEVETTSIAVHGDEIFRDLCAQCHGPQGEGGIGPSLRDPAFQAANSDDAIFRTISDGHPATPMIAWGEILTTDQISQLVAHIRSLEATGGPTSAAGETPSFQREVLPIFQTSCAPCHGTLGGWDASSYESVMGSGDHAPVIVPGDAEGSLLARMIRGDDPQVNAMPPAGRLSQDQIDLILKWIEAGAPDS